MGYINVEGLPEPIVRGLEVIVEMARKLAGHQSPVPRRERRRVALHRLCHGGQRTTVT
jgi:hypothetical protein